MHELGHAHGYMGDDYRTDDDRDVSAFADDNVNTTTQSDVTLLKWNHHIDDLNTESGKLKCSARNTKSTLNKQYIKIHHHLIHFQIIIEVLYITTLNSKGFESIDIGEIYCQPSTKLLWTFHTVHVKLFPLLLVVRLVLA